jgi:4'-phosphopantetheinyl transferase
MQIPYDRYSIDLAIDPDSQARYYAWLSADECDRAQRFKNPQHQRDFIAARGALRSHLSQYLNCHPKELRFDYGDHGKPSLINHPTLHFNLAHSHERALIVVCKTASIGVDLEKVRPIPKLLALAKRFFSTSEFESIAALPEALQPEKFFAYWTCKEAYLKATGTGLSQISKLELEIEKSVKILNSPCDRRFSLAQISHQEISDRGFADQTEDSVFVGAVAIEIDPPNPLGKGGPEFLESLERGREPEFLE